MVQAPFDPQSLNRYVYCRNNPIKYVDPTGNFFWFTAMMGAIYGAMSAQQAGYRTSDQEFWEHVITGALIGGYTGAPGPGESMYSQATFFMGSFSYSDERGWTVSAFFSQPFDLGGGGSNSNRTFSGPPRNSQLYRRTGFERPITLYDYRYATSGRSDYLFFDGENLRWFTDDEIVYDWPATSGPFGKGRLPNGEYSATNLRERTRKGMRDPSKFGWSIDINPNFKTNREYLRIHPDEKPSGTEGCIGVKGKDTRPIFNTFDVYFESEGYIIVIVGY